MKNINKRFQTPEEYHKEIERASIIIRGTESMEARARMFKYRMRLEKELFMLLEEMNNER